MVWQPLTLLELRVAPRVQRNVEHRWRLRVGLQRVCVVRSQELVRSRHSAAALPQPCIYFATQSLADPFQAIGQSCQKTTLDLNKFVRTAIGIKVPALRHGVARVERSAAASQMGAPQPPAQALGHVSSEGCTASSPVSCSRCAKEQPTFLYC